jgi:hypothetical protein
MDLMGIGIVVLIVVAIVVFYKIVNAVLEYCSKCGTFNLEVASTSVREDHFGHTEQRYVHTTVRKCTRCGHVKTSETRTSSRT